MARATLLDVAASKNTDKVVGLIEESLASAPEIGVFDARSIRGTSFLTLRRTGLPTAGFRDANAGFTPSKSTFAQGEARCYIFGGVVQCDKAVAQAWEDGSSAFEMIEAQGVMEAALRQLGAQIWYGVSNEAKGFAGCKAFTPFGGAMTVTAGGSTATSMSSVYAVKFGPKHAQIILGNEASFDLSPFRDENFLDADSKVVTGRVADLLAWTGLALNHPNCVARLCNLDVDATAGKTCSDAWLQKLVDKFPVGITPDAIFMSRRSRSQLQTSRSVTLFGQGSTRPNQPVIAPTPTEYGGIPIIATDCILNTDAVES
jgi:hypothetical protein